MQMSPRSDFQLNGVAASDLLKLLHYYQGVAAGSAHVIGQGRCDGQGDGLLAQALGCVAGACGRRPGAG